MMEKLIHPSQIFTHFYRIFSEYRETEKKNNWKIKKINFKEMSNSSSSYL